MRPLCPLLVVVICLLTERVSTDTIKRPILGTSFALVDDVLQGSPYKGCDWTEWSACSVSCGKGKKVRQRTVASSKEGGECGTDENQDCDTHIPCEMLEYNKDCEFGAWIQWSPCTVTCEGGEQSRARPIVSAAIGVGKCDLNQQYEGRKCGTKPCPIHCEWASWKGWSECQNMHGDKVTCGGGMHFRVRKKAKEAKHDGENCIGSFVEEEVCNNLDCPEDCIWYPWGMWSQCSATCGTSGQRIRARTVRKQAKNGGKKCEPSSSVERQLCNQESCPRDCEVDEWSPWHHCNSTCKGFSNRTRKIYEAKHGGKACAPNMEPIEFKPCEGDDCVPDCVMGEWDEWSKCTKCGPGGVRKRTREAVTGDSVVCTPKDNVEEESCANVVCPRNCEWSAWNEWEPCSSDCGMGIRFRNRTITVPESDGGICEGDPLEKEICEGPCGKPGDPPKRAKGDEPKFSQQGSVNITGAWELSVQEDKAKQVVDSLTYRGAIDMALSNVTGLNGIYFSSSVLPVNINTCRVEYLIRLPFLNATVESYLRQHLASSNTQEVSSCVEAAVSHVDTSLKVTVSEVEGPFIVSTWSTSATTTLAAKSTAAKSTSKSTSTATTTATAAVKAASSSREDIPVALALFSAALLWLF